MVKSIDKHLRRRRLDYSGHSIDDSIVIGNYGVVSFKARGVFGLSGIIINKKNEVVFDVDGTGVIKFHGSCKYLVINFASGDCVLDFTEVKVQEAMCQSITGSAEVRLGNVKRITRICLDQNAILRLECKPIIHQLDVGKHAKIIYNSK